MRTAVIEQRLTKICHTISGIYMARGPLAPPLYFFSRRTNVAGELPISPPNFVLCIEDPQAVKANTRMPGLELTDKHSRDHGLYPHLALNGTGRA